jgi:hypothetical protein
MWRLRFCLPLTISIAFSISVACSVATTAIDYIKYIFGCARSLMFGFLAQLKAHICDAHRERGLEHWIPMHALALGTHDLHRQLLRCAYFLHFSYSL